MKTYSEQRPTVLFLFIILWRTKIRPKYSMTLLAECDDDLRINICTNWITKKNHQSHKQTQSNIFINIQLMVVFFCATRSKRCGDLREENTKLMYYAYSFDMKLNILNINFRSVWHWWRTRSIDLIADFWSFQKRGMFCVCFMQSGLLFFFFFAWKRTSNVTSFFSIKLLCLKSKFTWNCKNCCQWTWNKEDFYLRQTPR